MTHVFIAHSPVDLDPLLQVHEALRQNGIADWYPTSAAAAEDAELITAQVRQAFALVVIVSADSIRSRHVQRDIAIARANGVPIVPYRLDSARLTGTFKTEIAPLLKLHADHPGAMDQLVAEIRGLYHRRCPVLAVMNLKGGIGKTTLTAQVFGAHQAAQANRVLLIDLDPQYNLTQVFFDMEDADARAARDCSVISLFEKSTLHAASAASPATEWSSLSVEPFSPPQPEQIVYPLLGEDGPDGRLDIITGQFEISKYAFATDAAALLRVKANFLAQIEALRSEYDLIVFDTNPNATFLTQCALEAANRVIAPMHPDVYSLRGVRLLAQVIARHVPEDLRPDLSVLFNMVQRQEQSDFEADARNGLFDQSAGFALSGAVLPTALPRTGHLVVKEPDADEPKWKQLVIHNGRGGGLRSIRQLLGAAGSEIAALDARHATNRHEAA